MTPTAPPNCGPRGRCGKSMGAYILRRLLLVIPTLLGVMIINFTLVQFVPGGPIEQVIAQMQGQGDTMRGFSGGGDDAARPAPSGEEPYIGARGLPPEFIAQLEREFGFDKPPLERFLTMMWNYLQFDFGESYFKSQSVISMVVERLPRSISLGLWSTLIAYAVSIPLGIRKAVRDGTPFDTWTSGVIIVGYAIPGFLFAILLLILFAGGSYWQIFPSRGLTSEQEVWDQLSWAGKIVDYFWHIALPTLALTISSFATLTLLTKNSFLDELRKQYVMTARAKGLMENRVLYGHVFRNAMLIVIAGFPAVFIGAFFSGSLIIETVFSIEGLGRLFFDAAVARDYPLIFGTLYIFTLMGLVIGILSDLMYVWIDPRIDFDSRAT